MMESFRTSSSHKRKIQSGQSPALGVTYARRGPVGSSEACRFEGLSSSSSPANVAFTWWLSSPGLRSHPPLHFTDAAELP
eukprot:2752469-Karenia_brevis.AAC.1